MKNKIKYYIQWKSCAGKAIEVEDLGFVSYYFVKNVLFKFKNKGVNYHGEYRSCRLPNGKVKNLLFRIETKEISPYVNKSSTLHYNSNNPISEINLLIDSPQEVELKVLNKNVFPKNKVEYIKILDSYIKMFPMLKKANSVGYRIICIRRELIDAKGEKLRMLYKSLKEHRKKYSSVYISISQYINENSK